MKSILHVIDNICADLYLADIQLMSTFTKRFRFLFCVIDIYRKCELFFFLNINKILQLLMFSKNVQMNLMVNQTKYG